ncbi:MAG: 2-hydroxyacyl-CoA dehydratase [Clostridia bacterium]|nr:2-hydroxyacyl-CoA dehydratase [Clostridia bacterium]
MKEKIYCLGIDIGSTTAKLVLLEDGKIIYSSYERHGADPRRKICEMMSRLDSLIGDGSVKVALSGSGGMGIAEELDVAFIQEVHATAIVVKKEAPDAKTVIELGGEDAKIIFLEHGTDARMNGTCAGGTGAFIDQMSSLLHVDNDEFDRMSLEATQIYPIASRCGVFAKSDIQSLINQGVSKENIAASVYRAVVNQTVGGLAGGTPIKAPVVFLGGPLHFCAGLRKSFADMLGLSDSEAVSPEYDSISVALGAAIYSDGENRSYSFGELLTLFKSAIDDNKKFVHSAPLFESREEYDEFVTRHKKASAEYRDINKYTGRAFLGIDCGSTTTKMVLLAEDDSILFEYYGANRGNPVDVVKTQLEKIYELSGDRITICGSASTGYGEELVKNAFHLDGGLVETMAHLKAAQFFNKDVDFIIDIGGQDIKCFKIPNGAIDSVMLNEACSSGCGSFLETFANALGLSAEEFAKRGLFAKAPAELGSRCTVFMNSAVKQAQRDGAAVEDISAGLCLSVVKNALYKVIRVNSPSDLGKCIVVQGGTFYNDSVLRCFEREIGRYVIRPAIAGLMGAFGAALYAKEERLSKSGMLGAEELVGFTHSSRSMTCKGCQNACSLTVNTFSDGKKYVSGNRCEKMTGRADSVSRGNIYEFKRQYLTSLGGGEGEKISIPLGLEMYDAAPYWDGLLKSLGFSVRFSKLSTKQTFYNGQFSVTSDTVCYPAKLMHGHVENLIADGAKTVFYPCCSYNFKEEGTANSYHCPVVAYYSEVLNSSMNSLKSVRFWFPYLDLSDSKRVLFGLKKFFDGQGYKFSTSKIQKAIADGEKKYAEYRLAVRTECEKIISDSRERGERIIVLAGRPYHVDPEINHGIDTLVTSLGCAVVSEDGIEHLGGLPEVNILNQWTYHSRLFKAANAVTENDDLELVQLVSFGCGIDAITTDELRAILEGKGKHYTQLKIDEITNLGAVKIRLRSLLSALGGNKKGGRV